MFFQENENFKRKKNENNKDNTACYVGFFKLKSGSRRSQQFAKQFHPPKKWKYILLAINHWHLFSLIFLETQLHVP